MNIFYLSHNPVEAAAMHCDKRCVKMLTEYAQMMSTAHRVLDGEMYIGKTKNGRHTVQTRCRETIQGIACEPSE